MAELELGETEIVLSAAVESWLSAALPLHATNNGHIKIITDNHFIFL
jgi:hypothetical protein